ncbi:lipopolysaccharide heptosyltransferase family protein [Synechococcus sp. RSCCF101]|uniref:glycosyltransferase family 9 protein n=1 Tax=Synechococcus sp. RSCCF101 TaxID=2511069 RepID=UPI001245F99C|nr:lipopolysaccharide heptosyltransferase family protein [Synechococcus sp. RSCCF101]QEY30956.1 lipopolysaccharide heptosyltransferase family protein [Synechococcus sp. RSCCF101]
MAAAAAQLNAQVQVACPMAMAPIWKLLPEVEKAIPFSFESSASLADWANLLGAVREPDFQACVNLAAGWPVNLLLSLSHIPNRVASGGFASTSVVQPDDGLWPPQQLAAHLQPLGMSLDADAFRLRLPRTALDRASTELPAGTGPLLLLAGSGDSGDWLHAHREELLEQLRVRLPDLRVHGLNPTGNPVERAALIAGADLLLSENPAATRLALYNGIPTVALGAGAVSLPQREQVKGLTGAQVSVQEVLQALGMG